MRKTPTPASNSARQTQEAQTRQRRLRNLLRLPRNEDQLPLLNAADFNPSPNSQSALPENAKQAKDSDSQSNFGVPWSGSQRQVFVDGVVNLHLGTRDDGADSQENSKTDKPAFRSPGDAAPSPS